MKHIEWNRDRSIRLSLAGVVLFAVLLLGLDAGGWWLAERYVQSRFWPWQYGILLLASIYSGSVFAWICLWQLWRLLRQLQKGAVFVGENVDRMRRISWCCVSAALISLASALYYLPFLFVAVAAGFMALIVRVVKNAFQQAIAMQQELDLTI